MPTMEEVRKVKEKYEKKLIKKYGVTGCAVGYKYIDGKKTNQLCIICYVNKKITIEKLTKKDMIPKLIEGIPTDVVESGEFRAL